MSLKKTLEHTCAWAPVKAYILKELDLQPVQFGCGYNNSYVP